MAGYLARCKCGAIVMAVADGRDDDKSARSDTAHEVANAIRDGFVVERFEDPDVVRLGAWCECDEREKREKHEQD